MKLIKFLWQMSPRTILFAALCGIVSGLSSTLLIVVIHRALNDLSQTSEILVMGFMGLCVCNLIFSVLSQVLLIALSEGAIFKLRLKMARGILGTPLRQLEKLGSHRLLTTLTDDVRNLSGGLLCIPITGVQFIVIFGCLGYLGWLSLRLLIFVVSFMAVAIISYHIPVQYALTRLRKARDNQDTLFKHFEALTQGTKELKLNSDRRQTFLSKVFQPTAQLYRRHNMIGFSLYTCAANWGYLMFFVMMGLLLFVMPEKLQINQEVLVGATLIILFLRAPLETIFTLLPELGRSQISLNKLEELGLSLTGNEYEGQVTGTSEVSKDICAHIKDVQHRYHHEGEAQDFILGPINLEFYKGEVVFLVGGNGSGKTTLAKILIGLYPPESGSIHFEGQTLSQENLEVYRKRFATVFSDFYLFESLLGLMSPDIDEKAKQYLKELQLHHKVQIKNGVFSTLELSQGQRKRLALLTAYLEDRPFYVFDEWAADQDPLFKNLFYTVMLPELKNRGKTVLCITHDDKYFDTADRIIKLDYGKIEFVGSHQDSTVTV